MFYTANLKKTSDALRSGELELRRYLRDILQRMDEWNPTIHAFCDEPNRRERIFEEGERLLLRFPTPANRPPLFGIPVGVKDLFHVEGLPTHAGSQLPASSLADSESPIVSKLRQNGAIVLGKTQMDEFAYAAPSPTRNPHDVRHTPGGSSSGSAASVTVGMCPVAIGTQTTRSITAPASFCGVLGFKPSYGRIPLEHVVWMSQSMDTLGWFTQDMESMVRFASVMMDDWQPKPLHRKPVIGIPKGKFMTFMMDETRSAFEELLATLTERGYNIQQVDMPWEASIDDLYPDTIRLVTAEMAEYHSDLVRQHQELYHPYTLKGIEHGSTVSRDDVERLRAQQISLRQALHRVAYEAGIDIWLTPSQAVSAPEGTEPTGYGGMTIPWSFAGLPTLSLPAMQVKGLPVGIQCVGRFREDEHLLAAASALAEELPKNL